MSHTRTHPIHPFTLGSLWAARLGILLLCISCAAVASDRIMPPLKSEATARRGEPMLHQGTIVQRAAIHLSDEIIFGEGGAYALTPGYYVRGGVSDDWETYSSADGADAGQVKKAPGAITLQGAFLYSKDEKTLAVVTNFYQSIHASAKGVTKTTRPVLSSESIQRFLIYGGKSGTRVKIAYQETWRNITRPSSPIFIEYDLANSKRLPIGGAEIEVVDATENSIRYRVRRAFDSSRE